MYFNMKNTLKNNYNNTPKQSNINRFHAFKVFFFKY